MQKSWLVTFILCIFLGYLGIHRFYTGNVVTGILQILTGGGCGLWVLLDIILLLTGLYRDGNGQSLQGWSMVFVIAFLVMLLLVGIFSAIYFLIMGYGQVVA